MAEQNDLVERLQAELSATKAKLAKALDFIGDLADHNFEVLRAPLPRHPADEEDDATPLPMVLAWQDDARTLLAEIQPQSTAG